MLKSLYIKNFRLFKELKIERLERVNLIVGKNNSGKTGLLEALLIYATNAAPDLLEALISQRSENWETKANPLRHLFYGRRFPHDEGIKIGPLNPPNNRIHLRTRHYQRLENEAGARRIMPIDEPHSNDLVDVFMALEFQETGDGKPLLLSSMDARRYFQTPKAKMDVEFVSTGRNSKRIAELWDNINLTDLKEEVVAALKIIEPSIRDVGLTIGNDNKRFVIVRLKGSSARLSLESLGEGMSRLFHLTLALVNSSNGFLLIDEFENGLHYTVLPLVWKFIFRLAKDLNVQAFATTHSHDCVTAFQGAYQNSEEATLFRLGRSVRSSDNGKIIAIEYDKEELQLVAQSEVRG